MQLSKTLKNELSGYKVSSEFHEQYLPIPPYILGLWLGDGNRAKPELFINKGEPEILKSWEDYAKSLGCNIRIEDGEGCIGAWLNHELNPHKPNPFWKSIQDLGLERNKHIPSVYIRSSKMQRLQLLAGLVNSDGWSSGPRRCSVNIGNTNEAMLQQAADIANSLGFYTHLKMYRGIHTSVIAGRTHICKPYYHLCISAISEEFIELLLPHKRPIRKPSKKDVTISKLEITKLGVGSYVSVEVDKDHKFVLQDGTVVNNCLTGVYVIVNGTMTVQEFIPHFLSWCQQLLETNTIPGATKIQCGNAEFQNLPLAKQCIKDFLLAMIDKIPHEYKYIE